MAVAVRQPNGTVALLTSTSSGGVETLTVTNAAADSVLLLQQPDGSWAKIAAVANGSQYTLCVR